MVRSAQQRYGLKPGGRRGLRMTHGSLGQRPYSLYSRLLNQIYRRYICDIDLKMESFFGWRRAASVLTSFAVDVETAKIEFFKKLP